MPDYRETTFPEEVPPDVADFIVTFWGVLDNQRIECRITREALEDHFGAQSGSAADLISSYRANKAIIQEAAREVLMLGDEPTCLLKTNFF